MTVGEMLVVARERAGKSLDDVAAVTKIRPSILAAMEEDDFSHCGGSVYARGQLRSIASVIGIDPDELIRAYDAQE